MQIELPSIKRTHKCKQDRVTRTCWQRPVPDLWLHSYNCLQENLKSRRKLEEFDYGWSLKIHTILVLLKRRQEPMPILCSRRNTKAFTDGIKEHETWRVGRNQSTSAALPGVGRWVPVRGSGRWALPSFQPWTRFASGGVQNKGYCAMAEKITY